jgi:hypothetical protein
LRHALWLTLAVAAFPGNAFVITNLTRGTVLFEDSFERGAAGFAPGAKDPRPGAWAFNGDPVLVVAGPPTESVQAAEGTNCLKIARGARPRLTAVGETNAVASSGQGDRMRIEFALRVDAGVASVYPVTTNHDIGQICFFADGRVSVVNTAGTAHQFLSQALKPRAWNRVRLESANGSAEWSVSVNGAAPEKRTSGSSEDLRSGGRLTGARLQTDEAGTLAYFDHDAPPPPPAPVLLYQVAGASIAFRWEAPGFRLETCYDLAEPDAWFPWPGGTNSPVSLTPDSQAQFFRLSNSTALPPAPRDIGTQTQLWVDETLIASLDAVRLHVNPIEKLGWPIVSPDEAWEGTAIQISGVFRDPGDGLFKMWYTTHADPDSGKAPGARTCYAESADGVQWTKPRLGLVGFLGSKQNSVVQDVASGGAAPSLDYVVFDPRPGEEARRFKALVVTTAGYHLWWSGDGKRWVAYGQNPVCDTTGDVSPTMFDERQGQFVAFMKTGATVAGRPRRIVAFRPGKPCSARRGTAASGPG